MKNIEEDRSIEWTDRWRDDYLSLREQKINNSMNGLVINKQKEYPRKQSSAASEHSKYQELK